MSSHPSQALGPSQLPPPLTGDKPQNSTTTGETFIGITCMLLVLCTVAVVGRLVARRMAKARLEADDFVSLLALLLLVVVAIENFCFVHYVSQMQGPGPPNMSALRGLGHLNLVAPLTYGFLMTAARCSVLLLYRRIFSLCNWSFKWLWWICLCLVVGYLIALLVGVLLQCRPHSVAMLWQNPPECRNGNNEIMIMAFLNVAVDVCVLVLPIRPVWALKMPLGRRVMVCGLFGIGLLGVAISLARAAVLIDPNALENGGGFTFSSWSTAEAAVALLCSCLPLTRPLFVRAYDKTHSIRTRLGISNRLSSSRLPLFRGGLKTDQGTVQATASGTPGDTKRHLSL